MVNVIIIGAHDFNVTEALVCAARNNFPIFIYNVDPYTITTIECDKLIKKLEFDLKSQIPEFTADQFRYISPNFDFALPYPQPKNILLSRRTLKFFHHFDIDYG